MNANGKVAIGSLIWMQAIFLGSAFQTWFPVIAATVLATLVVTAEHRRGSGSPTNALSSKSAVRGALHSGFVFLALIAILSVTFLWRVGNESDAEINLFSVWVEAIAHWGLFSSLLLWGLRPNRGHVAMLGLGMVVLLFGVAAGGTSRSISAQTSIALSACIGFTLAAQIILGTAHRTGGALFTHDDSSDEQTRWMGRIVSLTTISLILMTTGVVANTTNRILPDLQQALQKQLHESLDAVVDRTGIGGTRYVQSGKLGSVRQHMTSNPTEVALVVDSTISPGYLRGRAYEIYDRRRWRNVSRMDRGVQSPTFFHDRRIRPSSEGKIELSYPVSPPLMRFDLRINPRTTSVVKTLPHLVIHNDPLKGQVVFTPLAIEWIEANSHELVIGQHDVIRMGIDLTKPYVVGVESISRRDVLTPDQHELLTTIPEAIKVDVWRVADVVCSDTGTARTNAVAVSKYFQTESNYSLRPPVAPRGVDPIAHFLRQRHPAHCEYFASATVLVLRSVGIPARYVTGYVVDEPHESQPNLWLSRNRDAHAWAEAYDDQTKRWFAVESTPGRTYRTVSSANNGSADGNLADLILDRSFSSSDSLFGQAWIALRSLRATDALVVIFQLAQLPLLLGLVGFWWVKFRRTSDGRKNEMDAKSLSMLHRVDRGARKYALTRDQSETLHQFADRIESNSAKIDNGDVADQLGTFAVWYRQYANARYCGKLPEPLVS